MMRPKHGTIRWPGLLLALLLAVAAPLGLGACDRDEGAFEEAGEAIDDAADDAKDELDD